MMMKIQCPMAAMIAPTSAKPTNHLHRPKPPAEHKQVKQLQAQYNEAEHLRQHLLWSLERPHPQLHNDVSPPP
jgi:hypothetical protein